MNNAECKNGWVSSPYEFSGLMLAPNKEFIIKRHKAYELTFEGEPELCLRGDEPWYWFKFTGREKK